MDQINQLFEKVKIEARAIGIPISDKIKEGIVINRRARSRFGCCKKIRKGAAEIFEIELSYRLLDCAEKAIRQTLAHEVLHTCPQCANHGGQWRRYAEMMNAAYGYDIKRTDTAERLGIKNELRGAEKKPEEKYVIVCQKCGARITRSRMSKVIKYPQKYRCRCGGRLERIK